MPALIVAPQFVDLEQPAVVRVLLRQVIEHGEIVGSDLRGHTILQVELVAEPRLLDRFAAVGSATEDAEDGGVFVGSLPASSGSEQAPHAKRALA